MVGTGTKVLMLIFFIHVALYIGVEETRAVTGPFITDFGHVTIEHGENMTVIGSENQTMEQYNITAGDDIVSGTGIYTYNPLTAVWGVLTFMWGFLTAPLTLLVLDIPWEVKLIFIAPLGVLYFMALIAFVRGSEV